MWQISSNTLILCGAVIVVFLALIIPVSATFQVQQSTINPAATPLQPGDNVTVNAVIVIIPQGTTTFIAGHQLQFTTNLNDPRWDIQVMVNGIPGAVIPAKGNTVFINGFLLSYPDNNDVSVSVSVAGTVPAGIPAVTLLQVTQLNNAGQSVPGATQTISEPVAEPAVTVVVTTEPQKTISTPVMTTPTKAATSPLLLTTIFIAGILVTRRIKKD
jgi:hypothetical protein